MGWINDIAFVHPYLLSLLVIIPGLVYWYRRHLRGQQTRLTLPTTAPIAGRESWRARLTRYLPLLRWLALGLMIVALARPQLTLKEENIKAEGIDIVLAMDISSSMLAQDFDPDRLRVSIEVGKAFIDKRVHDRIGLVVFAGESFTQCPLTTDHRVVKEFLDGLRVGLLEDGTAIGMGLASAVNRIKESEAKSKVIILLTDGVNNSGYIKPLTAAEIAKELDTRVYTIGVGTRGQARSPVSRRRDGSYIFGLNNVQIDEPLLQQISDMTGGAYYRATDAASLEAIYGQIDQLEKTEMEITTIKRYSEEFRQFLSLALMLFLLEILLRLTILKTLP